MFRASRLPISLRRPRSTFIIVSTILALLYILDPFAGVGRRRHDVWREKPYVQPLKPYIRDQKVAISSTTRCKNFPPNVFAKIQIIVKIGAPEARTKFAKQLAANTACVKDLLVFSDYEEDVDGRHIYDALANLRKSEWVNNPDFDLYRDNKEARDRGDVLDRSNEGWSLDKYKFLPMMDMTWEMARHKDWFVFIEADSYLFWDNLFRWLGHLNPSKPLYMGSPVWQNDPNGTIFAHGGSGIVMSRAGLKKLVRPPGYDCQVAGCTQYGVGLQERCCGDAVLAELLRERGILLKGYWPMINGETHATLRYGRKDEQWCEPIIFMHHMSDIDQAEVAQWEMRRASPDPIIFEDLWNWQEHLLSTRRTDWEILPEGQTFKAVKGEDIGLSPEACQQACSEKAWCFQWQYQNDACELSEHIRFGRVPKPSNDSDVCISGTIMKHVAAFKKSAGHCRDAHWVHPNPK